ncbi:MAG: hypothetical protein ATN36_07545 [Epulopiscium sp. Nele67-Bin005]|nr:MAG: hypothetical protein ATN36_07545 [Epulopiscium sp. Nele67-Bin005]
MNAEEIYELGIQAFENEDFAKAFGYYKISAIQGNALAQLNLGNCYKNGQGVKQDNKKAARWYSLSADQGDADAQNNLGYCYQYGEGVEQDNEQAVHWYSLSAEAGNSKAQYNLGYCYKNGRGVEKDFEEAVRWYTLSAEAGNSKAQINLGNCYKNGHGVEQDDKQAVHWYALSAEAGNAKAQYNLGYCYKNGRGVEQDYEQAVHWYALSAEQGFGYAFNWLKRLANEEITQTYLALGNCYHYGYATDCDENSAIEWYIKALEFDYEEAFNQLEILATDDYPHAQYHLGLCYMNNNSQNRSKAMEFFEQAANQEHAQALYILDMFNSLVQTSSEVKL